MKSGDLHEHKSPRHHGWCPCEFRDLVHPLFGGHVLDALMALHHMFPLIPTLPLHKLVEDVNHVLPANPEVGWRCCHRSSSLAPRQKIITRSSRCNLALGFTMDFSWVPNCRPPCRASADLRVANLVLDRGEPGIPAKGASMCVCIYVPGNRSYSGIGIAICGRHHPACASS